MNYTQQAQQTVYEAALRAEQSMNCLGQINTLMAETCALLAQASEGGLGEVKRKVAAFLASELPAFENKVRDLVTAIADEGAKMV